MAAILVSFSSKWRPARGALVLAPGKNRNSMPKGTYEPNLVLLEELEPKIPKVPDYILCRPVVFGRCARAIIVVGTGV